ncbi:hypothetical protein TNCV_4218001 [Trichonephila clavipes]|nr:hypothetical protein TNCV_4218001 [Trichonephila clavipes]
MASSAKEQKVQDSKANLNPIDNCISRKCFNWTPFPSDIGDCAEIDVKAGRENDDFLEDEITVRIEVVHQQVEARRWVSDADMFA